jgi:CheY-like chemotaxis protein
VSESPSDPQAPESLGELDQFARVIAHDFNNLLCSILGNAELLGRGADGDPKRLRRVNSIRKAAARGVELTRKLSGFGAGGAIHPELIDPLKVLEADLQRFRESLPGTMQLRVEVTPDTRLFADPAALQQIVAELLCNAREFSKPSGQIHLKITLEKAGKGCLRIADTGSGFPPNLRPEDLTKAFVTTGKAGRGIGLAAVQARVLAHGGRLDLFNQGGAVAECLFPAQRSPAESPAMLATQDPLSVWVAEDEPALLEFIVDVLESKGFQVLAYSGSEDLLAAYEPDTQPPDVLLLDVVLPGRSGPDLLQALQKRGFDAPVLWSSGFTADAAELGLQGQSAFLQKPYTPADLCLAIRSLAAKSTAAKSSPAKSGQPD